MLSGKPCISTIGAPVPGVTSACNRYGPLVTGSVWPAWLTSVIPWPPGACVYDICVRRFGDRFFEDGTSRPPAWASLKGVPRGGIFRGRLAAPKCRRGFRGDYASLAGRKLDGFCGPCMHNFSESGLYGT